MRRPRDSQRSRVYAWERSLGALDGPMAIDVCRDMVARVWMAERARYAEDGRMPAPKVVNKRSGAHANPWTHTVAFSERARTPWIVCHEVSHLLQSRSESWHGPRFVGILIGLLSRHLGHCHLELLRSAKRDSIKVDARSIGAAPQLEQWGRP